MAWDDREYYRDGANKAEYLGNPALFLTMSTNFGNWFGLPVRLSFWIILMLLLHYVNSLHGASVALISLTGLLFVGMLILHDWGHRFFAERVGGTLQSSLLWPYGGLNFPEVPPESKAIFIGFGGGIFAHLIVGGVALLALVPMEGIKVLETLRLNPALLPRFGIPLENIFTPLGLLREIVQINGMLILVNLLPFYWFDGGFLLEAALRLRLGISRSVRVTCIAGMCIAPLGFAYAVYRQELISMIFWAFLFAGSFNKFRAERGPWGDSGASSYASSLAQNAGRDVRRKPRWPNRSAVKKAAAQRREREKIDAILEKVHSSGMQSLTWGERRTLSKATERQRRNSGG